MRKDPSTVVTEFIQGGSLGDDNTNTNIAHTNINSVENLTSVVGDCDSTTNNSNNTCKAKSHHNLDCTNNNKEQREDNNDEESYSSMPILSCLSGSSSTVTEEAVVTTPSLETTNKKKKSVQFSNCSVRSYNQILGDHPLCAVGCPIALGWRVVNEECFTLDQHEAIRAPLRKKKGSKSPTNKSSRHRKRLSHNDDETSSASMEPSFKYINSQLRLSAHERRERLSDLSDAQIRMEWSRMQKQSKRGLIKEGLRQFRAVGMHYAGF